VIKLKEDTRKEIIELLRNWKTDKEELYVETGIRLILKVLLEKEGL
jgi:hypothetical protein